MNKVTMNVETLMKALNNIPAEIDRLRGTFSESNFWDCELEHTSTLIGVNNRTVKEEYKTVMELAADAVARYDLMMNDIENTSFKAAERNTYAFEWDCESFVNSVQKAEMKALWLNRECKRLTGKYFFTGRLAKINGSFTIESMFALVYFVFLAIDTDL